MLEDQLKHRREEETMKSRRKEEIKREEEGRDTSSIDFCRRRASSYSDCDIRDEHSDINDESEIISGDGREVVIQRVD